MKTLKKKKKRKENSQNFPGDPVVKNLPSNPGDAGLIPGRGTKISYPRATKPVSHNY